MNYKIIPVTPFQQNCSLLSCTATGQACVVDPGGDLGKIQAEIEKANLKLEKILLTHGHLDHAGAADEFAKLMGVEIEGPHQADDFWLQQLPMQGQMFGFGHYDAFSPMRWLDDGDKVTFGQVELDVIHCPGHTPGHVIFYSKDNQLAIVGDVLFKGSIGRTDFPMSNHQALIKAIKEKLLPLGDEIIRSLIVASCK